MSKKSYTFLPDFVYGSIDGTITTFAIVASAVGAQLPSVVVLILGFANVFADGFSMASSSYLSNESRQDLSQGGEEGVKPLTSASVTFGSFVGVGLIPLLPFVLEEFNLISHPMFYASVLAGLTFLSIGALRGRAVGKRALPSAFSTFAIGTIAALIAFFVGTFLDGVV